MKSQYREHRFPAEIISHAVWLYHRFTMSFRDVEDLLAEQVGGFHGFPPTPSSHCSYTVSGRLLSLATPTAQPA